ncbi:MAG: transposase [Bacteroidota bacterium]
MFGINEVLALDIVSEVGTDMRKWPTKKHFTAWLNLAPNNRISGGKHLRSKKQKKKNKAAQAFLGCLCLTTKRSLVRSVLSPDEGLTRGTSGDQGDSPKISCYLLLYG